LFLELDALIKERISDADKHAYKEVNLQLCTYALDVNANNVSNKHRHVENVEEACCGMMSLPESFPLEIHEIQNGLTAEQLQL